VEHFMQIERISIADLRPAPYNPRVGLKPGDAAYERLQRSLEEFDLVQPLVWNRRTGHVVGGHQRLEILKRRGVSEVECVVVDLPVEREKALNIALNNSRVAGDWEPQKLLDLVGELQSLPDFDATLTGFSEQELCDLVLRPADDFETEADSGLESEEAADLVTATLEVPRPRWDAVRLQLDALLAAEPEVALHIA
jgi:ParB-like chromosome segregation protein Spo0J